MAITPAEALKIVEAAEETASYFNDSDDHARRVTGSAFDDFARSLASALEVPNCTCRYSSYHHDLYYRDKNCPRAGFGEEE